jgi:hypothetical protein
VWKGVREYQFFQSDFGWIIDEEDGVRCVGRLIGQHCRCRKRFDASAARTDFTASCMADVILDAQEDAPAGAAGRHGPVRRGAAARSKTTPAPPSAEQ